LRFLKIKLNDFFLFLSFLFLLVIFQVFLGPNIRFVLKLIPIPIFVTLQSQLITNIETLLSVLFLAVLTVFILLTLQVMKKIAALFRDMLDYLLRFFSIAWHVFRVT